MEVLTHCEDTRRACVCLGNVALTHFVGSGSWGGEVSNDTDPLTQCGGNIAPSDDQIPYLCWGQKKVSHPRESVTGDRDYILHTSLLETFLMMCRSTWRRRSQI